MFDQFSDRARMVVFLARVVAGYQGATEIGNEHLLEGVIREDAPTRLLHPYNEGNVRVSPHPPFFGDSTAHELLAELNSLSPNHGPIQTNVDMPISSGLGRTFAGAVALANDSRSRNIEPLHLLAGIIQCDADICERLHRHGVKLDAVVAAIGSSGQ